MSALRPAPILLVVAASTLVHATPPLLIALCKALLPVAAVRRACNRMLAAIAESWSGLNNWMLHQAAPTRVEVACVVPLRPVGDDLVLANHQAWVDILILQKAVNRRI